VQKFCARYKNGEGNFRTFPTLPQVSLVHKFSPQMMSYHSFSSDFIRDEPWVSEHIISDTDLEPVALLYQSCLGRPFITDAVCKIGNAEILVTGAFGAALKKIEAVWAKQENCGRAPGSSGPHWEVENWCAVSQKQTLHAHICLGMTTLLRYMLIREACRSQPAVLYAFDHWYIFTPSGIVFRFDDKKRIPNFENKLFNKGIICLVDAVGSQGRNLHWTFAQANMRYVQVVTREQEKQFACRRICTATRLYFGTPTVDEKNRMWVLFALYHPL